MIKKNNNLKINCSEILKCVDAKRDKQGYAMVIFFVFHLSLT